MKTVAGSALVMIIFLTSIIIIAITASWYSALLLHDAGRMRQQSFQQTQSVQALLTYAMHQAKRTDATWWNSDKPIILYQGSWPLTRTGVTSGYAVGVRYGTGVKVSATLYNGSQKLITLSSLLEKAANTDRLAISEWGIRDAVT